MSDIDTAAADGLKALDPNRPIREADIKIALSGPSLLRCAASDAMLLIIVRFLIRLTLLRNRLLTRVFGVSEHTGIFREGI